MVSKVTHQPNAISGVAISAAIAADNQRIHRLSALGAVAQGVAQRKSIAFEWDSHIRPSTTRCHKFSPGSGKTFYRRKFGGIGHRLLSLVSKLSVN